MMTLGELAEVIPGATLAGNPETRFSHVTTDTRSIPDQAVFFALRGERFDAHDFAAQAVNGGALALIVEKQLGLDVDQIVVPDTRLALGAAAAGWRARMKTLLIAVTGSNGKTTVTQMIASVLAAAAGEDGRLATRGNLNNDIGVPLTLFRLLPQHRLTVVELGMNHPGEIEYLAGLARPNVALVNNAQREHQEFMGTVEATAHENGSSISALPPDGIAVFPADDPCASIWRNLAANRQVMDFGFRKPAAVTASFDPSPEGMRLNLKTPQGLIEMNLRLAGAHNAHNAAAAATAALAVGITPDQIRKGLETFSPVSGRGVIRQSGAGTTVIDDTYNANPDSVRAAIELLGSLAGTRILILGDMGEVGEQGPEFHEEIGEYARARGVHTLLALGDLSRSSVDAFNHQNESPGEHFSAIEPLIARALQCAIADTTILVKGSRFMKMERVVEALCPSGTS